ncbi:Galactose oxidase kelch beta propeller [Echinococcus multilocularis]|uniref:Galactose oxidase kelch beta propeller n=1 Tax=Echinococcus multilocularis TaxID=6211 RepID=A0A068XVX4_ECHMU|nr:Galactose oxidase kelch beta propeller [Echinococcus multilocularis]
MPHTQELHTSTFITLSICVDIWLSPSSPSVGEQQPPHSSSGWVTLIESHIPRKRTHTSSGSLRRGLRSPSLSGQRRSWYSVAARNESLFILAATQDITAKEWAPPPANMPSARETPSALNIPDIGIVTVGRQKRGERLKSAEMLVEDPSGESGWRWIELNPMLGARNETGIAYFNGCVVVAGGHEGQPKVTVAFA